MRKNCYKRNCSDPELTACNLNYQIQNSCSRSFIVEVVLIVFFIVRYYALFIRVERAIYSLLKRDLVHVIRNVFGFLYDDKPRRKF